MADQAPRRANWRKRWVSFNNAMTNLEETISQEWRLQIPSISLSHIVWLLQSSNRNDLTRQTTRWHPCVAKRLRPDASLRYLKHVL